MSIQNRFNILNKITQTNSSILYKAFDDKTTKDVVIKVEKNIGEKSVLNETKMAKYLEKENIKGILKIMDFGIHQYKRYIVYPFVSETLYKKKMNRYDLFDCARQLLSILESIHCKGIVHCDISCRNILYCKNTKTYFLTDFGQARHYSFSMNENNAVEMVGSPTFCSVNIHKHYECLPRDDLISLGFLLLYCYCGELPWTGIRSCRDIREKKEDLIKDFWNLNIPGELKTYLNYCFHLGINQNAKYKLLQELFEIKRENNNTIGENPFVIIT